MVSVRQTIPIDVEALVRYTSDSEYQDEYVR